MKKIANANIASLFAEIAAQQELFLPVGEQGQAKYEKWQPGVKPADCLNTVRSAKDLFFPQMENMVSFKVSDKSIEIIEDRAEIAPFVLWGVRACDARSFGILDKVFYAEPVDTFYQSRREKVTVVTMACNAPEETCFCGALGIDPAEPAGDVSAWQVDDTTYLRANTEKGEALLNVLTTLEDADEAPVAAQQEKIRAITAMLPLNKLRLDKFGSDDNMMELFRSPKWAQLSESCLGCGTCTFVCPTCQCYDIREFKTNTGVKRFRCWDSCMYSDFTKMSAGQPRPTQLERFRQRFMHKLCYYPANHEGEFGCVGCGRCLQKCPISMNIVKVAKALGEEKA